MRKVLKKEPSTIRGICVTEGCGKPQVSKGSGQYRAYCAICWKKPYTRNKKSFCECCGFIPTHPCQLDVDHIDGNHKNNSKDNYQTLCANCHRLKTFLNRDFES